MADETEKNENAEPGTPDAEATPKRTRAAKPKADEAPADAIADAPEAKPKRARAAAKADDADAAEGDAGEAKPKRTRAAAKKADDAEAAGDGEAAEAEAKPKRTRARAKKADEAEAATEEAVAEEGATDEEAPKPARRRRAAAKPKAEEPAEPAAEPARGANGGGPARPVVRAQAKYVRSSARKARLVCDHIRGKSVEDARAILAFTPRAVARDWSKLLESAVANAEHNHELDGEDLLVKAAHADEGPTLKRFRPRAMGRATPIRKRTSHLTILLTPKE
jgi:ribosomal protein L22